MKKTWTLVDWQLELLEPTPSKSESILYFHSHSDLNAAVNVLEKLKVGNVNSENGGLFVFEE
jgi:hypothetical protein